MKRKRKTKSKNKSPLTSKTSRTKTPWPEAAMVELKAAQNALNNAMILITGY